MRTSTLIRDRSDRGEEQGNLQGESQTDLLQPHIETHLGMMVKQKMISGPFQGTTFTVITLNRESNCTCRELTKKQTTSRPDCLWPEIRKDVSEAAQRKENKKWAIEKPKLDNARRLRGIYFIDPADVEFKETLKKPRGESWKFRWQQQCPARSGEERTRKLVALLMLARQNAHASLKPTNLRESEWKELLTDIMKIITLQEKA